MGTPLPERSVLLCAYAVWAQDGQLGPDARRKPRLCTCANHANAQWIVHGVQQPVRQGCVPLDPASLQWMLAWPAPRVALAALTRKGAGAVLGELVLRGHQQELGERERVRQAPREVARRPWQIAQRVAAALQVCGP